MRCCTGYNIGLHRMSLHVIDILAITLGEGIGALLWLLRQVGYKALCIAREQKAGHEVVVSQLVLAIAEHELSQHLGHLGIIIEEIVLKTYLTLAAPVGVPQLLILRLVTSLLNPTTKSGYMTALNGVRLATRVLMF